MRSETQTASSRIRTRVAVFYATRLVVVQVRGGYLPRIPRMRM